MVRLRVAPQLTQREARRLQARAAADMRSVGGYVAWLLIKDLRRESGRKRRTTGVSPSDKRRAYERQVARNENRDRVRQADIRTIANNR